MLVRVIRKIIKNKWLYFSLCLGVILSIMVVTIVPMFSRAVQDRLLKRNMDEYSHIFKQHSGSVNYTFNKFSPSELDKLQNETKEVTKEFKLPIISEKRVLESERMSFWPKEVDLINNIRESYLGFKVVSLKNIEDNIEIVKGRVYSQEGEENGVFEVIVDEKTFNSRNLSLNTLYSTTFDGDVTESIRKIDDENLRNNCLSNFKIVGVFRIKENNFWLKGDWDLWYSALIMNEKNHLAMIKENDFSQHKFINEYYLDYSNIEYKDKKSMLKTVEKVNTLFAENGLEASFVFTKVFNSLNDKMKATTIVLLILFVPIIVILFSYVLMVSTIIVNNDKTEISLLKSRGAITNDIINSYVIQGIILGGIAIVIGPLLGKNIVKILGNANGFLEFVNRESLAVSINFSDYIYAFIVAIIFIITMVLPAYFASKKTIVETKRLKGRVKRKSIWKKYFLDIALVALSIYSFFNLNMKRGLLEKTAAKASQNPIDPLMFLIVISMCIGFGLLFLRIYPYIIKGIYLIRKKSWAPETYNILLNNCRDSSKKEYIMLFLILTLSIGIYNMNSARKMNNDGIDNISHLMGADVVLKEDWEYADNVSNYLIEEDYEKFKEVSGIEETAKVLRSTSVEIYNKRKGIYQLEFMSVIPEEFGKTAYMRSDLFPTHWYNYLNALSEKPYGVLVSSSLLEQGLKVGDDISIKLKDTSYKERDLKAAKEAEEASAPLGKPDDRTPAYFFECKIIGTFDYWPGWNSNVNPHMIVTNYNYVYNYINPMPYEVWIKTTDDASTKDIFNELQNKEANIAMYKTKQYYISSYKNNIFIQSINASYTFAFIMTLLVSFIGFIIFWLLTIRERELQFGILRSLGLDKRKLYKMLMIEQILSTGIAIVVGTIIGNIVFKLFSNITIMDELQGMRVLPDLIQTLSSDYVKLYSILGIMIVVVMIIIVTYISRLKIDQAVKLGED
ncbi:ABC transporter permease [Oceanirhabdus sp. W0125-5]|uniref:ABC transporter permease n=1 Tax=Oceanirhabdus sp. W0125-5 TaxID=2999116 RepID=UPI0022F2A9FF|nr:ABC transporter permease [Oceanirhabdus sp. W0125-5]WBW95609.1 FtsX-like permease family protein [Oceanirhabdus sp. W0125-5]